MRSHRHIWLQSLELLLVVGMLLSDWIILFLGGVGVGVGRRGCSSSLALLHLVPVSRCWQNAIFQCFRWGHVISVPVWDMKWNCEREPISCETHCCYHSFVPHKYIHTVTDIHTHILEVTWRDQSVVCLFSFDGLPDDDDQDDQHQRQHHAQHAHPLTGLPLHTTKKHVSLHTWKETKVFQMAVKEL